MYKTFANFRCQILKKIACSCTIYIHTCNLQCCHKVISNWLQFAANEVKVTDLLFHWVCLLAQIHCFWFSLDPWIAITQMLFVTGVGHVGEYKCFVAKLESTSQGSACSWQVAHVECQVLSTQIHKKGCKPTELEHPSLHREAAPCYTARIKPDVWYDMFRNLNVFNWAFLNIHCFI